MMVVRGRASMPGVRGWTGKLMIPDVLGRRVRAHRADTSRPGVRGVPRLLPVDHEVVAVFDRGGAERGQVGQHRAGRALRPDLSPRSIGCKKRSCCSGVPNCMIAGAMLETPIT